MSIENAPINQPTTEDVKNKFIETYSRELGVDSSQLYNSTVLGRVANANAAIWGLMFRLADWIYEQYFYPTQSIETLRKNPFGLVEQVGSKAVYSAKLENVKASELPKGTMFKSIRTGQKYITQNDAQTVRPDSQATFGTINVNVEAINTGKEQEIIKVGEKLQIVSVLSGIPAELEITSQQNVGVDPETVEQFRQRVILRSQIRPQGGASMDYYSWAIEVNGIVDSYVYVHSLGKVWVYPIAQGSGISRVPSDEQLHKVEQSIEKSPTSKYQDRRPINVEVEVLKPRVAQYRVQIKTTQTLLDTTRDQVKQSIINYIDSLRADMPTLNKFGKPVSPVDITVLVQGLLKNTKEEPAQLISVLLYNDVTGAQIQVIQSLEVASIGVIEPNNIIFMVG